MNVLSLFDGMSCGQIALAELGVFPANYFASEVDKHAIKQTQLNFPDTKQLGSVTELDGFDLPRIDLLMGGSPCQSFSFAGKRVGMVTTDNVEITDLEQYMDLKRNGFRFEGQSYLFWEYVRILTEIRLMNPDVKFLLENVKMAKNWEKVITGVLGVEPILINSSLVSAQNRKRLYWTNIEGVTVPEDKGILLGDVLENEVPEKYYLSERAVEGIQAHAAAQKEKGNGFSAQFPSRKANTLCARDYKDGRDNLISPDLLDDLKRLDARVAGMSVSSDGIRPWRDDKRKSGTGSIGTVRFPWSKADTLLTGRPQTLITDRLRRLTPTECARLQTVPEWYTWECSDTQQYKMCGNGWTVEVIKHILTNLF